MSRAAAQSVIPSLVPPARFTSTPLSLRYGLSEAELLEVEGQLQGLLIAKGLGPCGSRGVMAAGGERGGTQREAELLGGWPHSWHARLRKLRCPDFSVWQRPHNPHVFYAALSAAARDTAAMSKGEKINFLLHLHEKLQQASSKLARAIADRPKQHEQHHPQQPALPPHWPTVNAAAAAAHDSAENQASVANTAPVHHEGGLTVVLQQAQVAWKPAAFAGKAAPSKRRSAGSGRRARQATSSDSDEGDW